MNSLRKRGLQRNVVRVIGVETAPESREGCAGGLQLGRDLLPRILTCKEDIHTMAPVIDSPHQTESRYIVRLKSEVCKKRTGDLPTHAHGIVLSVRHRSLCLRALTASALTETTWVEAVWTTELKQELNRKAKDPGLLDLRVLASGRRKKKKTTNKSTMLGQTENGLCLRKM